MSSYSKRYIDNVVKALMDRVEDVRSSSDSSGMGYPINMLRDISIPSSVKHDESVNQVKHSESVKQSGSSSQSRPSTFIELLLKKKVKSESVKVESKKRKEYKVLRASDVVKILYEYYVLGRKQKDIANRYGVSQATVSYYVVKYRKYVYDVIDKCKGDIANYAECFTRNLRDIVLANHRRRKRKSRKRRKSS